MSTLFPYVLETRKWWVIVKICHLVLQIKHLCKCLIPITYNTFWKMYRLKPFISGTWLFCQLCGCMCLHLQDSQTAAPSSLQGSLGPQTKTHSMCFSYGCQSNWIIYRTCCFIKISTNICWGLYSNNILNRQQLLLNRSKLICAFFHRIHFHYQVLWQRCLWQRGRLRSCGQSHYKPPPSSSAVVCHAKRVKRYPDAIGRRPGTDTEPAQYNTNAFPHHYTTNNIYTLPFKTFLIYFCSASMHLID